ncbi:Uncharacterised protein [Enterobacter cloacae]|nr:Uncharacterised protein [Enterobacter cloacae]
MGNWHKVFHFETVAIPLVLVRSAVVLPLVFCVDVHGQAHRQASLNVCTQTHIPGALATGLVAAHVVDVVVCEIPLFERTKRQTGTSQFINGEAWFDLHEQWGTVVPDTFRVGVTAEEYRCVHVAIEIKPVFFCECFVLEVSIVTDLRSETGMVAAYHVNALVPPVGEVLWFVVFRCVNSERGGQSQNCTGCE